MNKNMAGNSGVQSGGINYAGGLYVYDRNKDQFVQLVERSKRQGMSRAGCTQIAETV